MPQGLHLPGAVALATCLVAAAPATARAASPASAPPFPEEEPLCILGIYAQAYAGNDVRAVGGLPWSRRTGAAQATVARTLTHRGSGSSATPAVIREKQSRISLLSAGYIRAMPSARSTLLAGATAALLAAAPAAEAKRFRTFVSCGVGFYEPTHRCSIGSAPHAMLRDNSGKGTRYNVCLRGPGRKFRFCTRARAPRGRAYSEVNLLRFDEEIGTYTVTWRRHGRRIGRSRFYFARGD